MDPFLLATIKNPLSAPALIFFHFLLAILIIFKLKFNSFISWQKAFPGFPNKEKFKKIIFLTLLIFLFLISSFLIFYNALVMPKAGYEDDDGIYAIGAKIIKQTGFDSVFEKEVPYFPLSYVSYHHEKIGGAGLRAVPCYFQVFLQYFIEAGHYSIRFENALLIFLSSIFIAYTICTEGGLVKDINLPLHALRQAAMLPPLVIICGLGLKNILDLNKIFFLSYTICIVINTVFFYYDYFSEYPKKLGTTWFNDPGLKKASRIAFELMKQNLQVKVFYNNSYTTFTYHNLDKLSTSELLNGSGILANVYNYYNKDNVEIKKGDLILAQEPFEYNSLNKKYKFVVRIRNKYLPNNEYGTSLFEITE